MVVAGRVGLDRLHGAALIACIPKAWAPAKAAAGRFGKVSPQGPDNCLQQGPPRERAKRDPEAKGPTSTVQVRWLSSVSQLANSCCA